MDTSNRTFVSSILFLDIVEYSKQSVTDQLALKQQFNNLLVDALKHVAASDRIVLDTGDGAAVSFQGNPEDSLFAGMHMRDAIASLPSDGLPKLEVRFGINLGPVRLIKDINGQLNIIGDGISVAQRVMSFAEPGCILVSRSYFEVVSRLSDDYAKIFSAAGTRTDKHVREHSVYEIGKSLDGMIEQRQNDSPKPGADETPATPDQMEVKSSISGRRFTARYWLAAGLAGMLAVIGLFFFAAQHSGGSVPAAQASASPDNPPSSLPKAAPP